MPACIELMQLFVDSCPLLSDVEFQCPEHDFVVSQMPERFVAKIRKFDFSQSRALADIIELFPSSAPHTIVTGYLPTSNSFTSTAFTQACGASPRISMQT